MMSAKCMWYGSTVLCIPSLTNKQVDDPEWSVSWWVVTTNTQPQFNVLSGVLIECLEELQHVEVCAASREPP